MDQAASDYVLAVRVLHTGSIIMTHAVGLEDRSLPLRRHGGPQEGQKDPLLRLRVREGRAGLWGLRPRRPDLRRGAQDQQLERFANRAFSGQHFSRQLSVLRAGAVKRE